MNATLNKIHNYLINQGYEEGYLAQLDTSSVYLAMEIMEYAHRDQKRVTGEAYANHPSRLLQKYRQMVGITEDDPFCMDKDLMYHYGIPFDGVQEVCLLHDVIEDTELTFEDVRDIYVECGFERYFDIYIASPLKNITHDKSVHYDSYIQICMNHPTSALVKMLDMQDNSDVFTLVHFGHKNYKRTLGYLNYMFEINQKFHFIENAEKYRNHFAIGAGV